jgi:hypothetical protein
VYAFAFVQLYFVEHPYKVASYWIFDNVPAGSRLAGPHWDDKVPVSVAGKNPSMYIMEGRENELPVYERDTPAVIDLLAKRMSAADYLMFPTPRTPDSIPRIPEEYPNTTALLRLLWGEKLGFKLVYSTKNRPSLLGMVFNDDLADESFSVYDHPKVVVFQNVEKLSKDEILRRIKTWNSYEPLPSMNEMLLMDAGGWQPTRRLLNPHWGTFVKALSVVLIIAGSVWVLTSRLFQFLPDGGLGLSGFVGLFVASGLAWLLGLAGLIPLTQSGAWFVVLLLGLLALARVLLKSSARAQLAPRLAQHGLYVLAAFVAGVAVVAWMRSSDTGFFGLGEPVELAYLSYLSKSAEVHPQDIFKPGSALSVLFVDRFALGWILKLVGIQPALALQTAYLVAGGILGAALYSVVVLCVRRPKAALLGVVIAIVPAAYLLHAARDSKNQALVQYDNLALLKSASAEQGLASWVRSAVKGTPCVVTACDTDTLKGLSAVVGLPACVEPVSGATEGAGAASNQGELCKTEDAQVAFRRMMELGFEFFVTPSSGLSAGAAAPKRTGQFEARPDLFAKVFDDGRVAVFVPAFSSYYPRPEEPVSS